eukprot:scaffold6263_cov107-Amphora_coffeaeformis.AAC.1
MSPRQIRYRHANRFPLFLPPGTGTGIVHETVARPLRQMLKCSGRAQKCHNHNHPSHVVDLDR